MEQDQFAWHGDLLASAGAPFFHGLPPLPPEELLGAGSFLPGNNYWEGISGQQLCVGSGVHPEAALAHLSADASSATLPPLQRQSAASWAGSFPENPWGFGGHLQPFDGVLLGQGQAQAQAQVLGPNQVDEEDDLAVETIQVARMVAMAAQCGQGEGARTVWSQEEHTQLLHGLDRYANEEPAMRCLWIACHLPNKTASDVALRYRWLQLQDKKRTAKEAELLDKSPAGEKVNKRKKTKAAKINKKIYPLSKEALDSKLTKELIWDNRMFLERIEENLKSGQLDKTADYFYYVKTNLDAIEKRLSGSGISMTLPTIDEEGLEEILKSRLSSLALKETARPADCTDTAAAVGDK